MLAKHAYVLRFRGKRQPLCGTGVVSVTDVILMPLACSSLAVLTLPNPIPFTFTSTVLKPSECACATHKNHCCYAQSSSPRHNDSKSTARLSTNTGGRDTVSIRCLDSTTCKLRRGLHERGHLDDTEAICGLLVPSSDNDHNNLKQSLLSACSCNGLTKVHPPFLRLRLPQPLLRGVMPSGNF